MNIKCIICSDLFVPHSEISTTTCGHLFHYSCILQWLDRSKTCPQCRNKTTEKTVYRIYVSVEDQVNISADPSTLQNHIDNLNMQLKLKAMDVENLKEKLKVSDAQTCGLRQEVKELEAKIKLVESAMYALKDQVKYFKNKTTDNQKLQEKLIVLKNKINELESVQLIISGSHEQVNDMLRHNRDPNSLTVLVSTLKKELVDSDRRKKQLQVMLKDVQNESQNKARELLSLTRETAILRKEIEAHKTCESEREYLKNKISELQAISTKGENHTHNSTINRILLESPVQLPQNKNSSPSVAEKVQAIQDSDSPYLKVQSSSVGLSELMNQHKNTKKPSILKHTTLKIENYRRQSSFASYDGLGGHSRDEHTPTQPLPSLLCKKRPKSSSSLPSAKLRKLAPPLKVDSSASHFKEHS